jgi:hypothetical protein
MRIDRRTISALRTLIGHHDWWALRSIAAYREWWGWWEAHQAGKFLEPIRVITARHTGDHQVQLQVDPIAFTEIRHRLRDWPTEGSHHPRARLIAERTFSALEAFLPRRIRNEEIGDALEYINAPGRSRSAIYTKTASTVFWVAANAARELMSVAWGRATK